MMYCECVPTPYSLANDPDDPLDVFEAIFPQYIDPDDPTQGEYPYWLEKRKALWARFHDTGIGNPDTDYWIRCMKGKHYEIAERYDIKFRVFAEYKARLAAASSVDLADSVVESESVRKTYDPPETTTAGAHATSYLDLQDDNNFIQTTHGGLESSTVSDYMDAVADPSEDFAREFDKLFYWGI